MCDMNLAICTGIYLAICTGRQAFKHSAIIQPIIALGQRPMGQYISIREITGMFDVCTTQFNTLALVRGSLKRSGLCGGGLMIRHLAGSSACYHVELSAFLLSIA